MKTQMMPVVSSISGYWIEMAALQLRHLPPSTSHERTGMLSYQAIILPQPGQRDRGLTTDSSLGQRWMQTFRKLPSIRPKKPPKIIARALSLTHHLVEKNAGRHGHI